MWHVSLMFLAKSANKSAGAPFFRCATHHARQNLRDLLVRLAQLRNDGEVFQRAGIAFDLAARRQLAQ